MKQKTYYVYILASKRNGTLYVGVTGDLKRRISEHKSKDSNSFSVKYSVDKLVFYEAFNDIDKALKQEKCIKKWNRAWKLQLIEERNPEWVDLSEDF